MQNFMWLAQIINRSQAPNVPRVEASEAAFASLLTLVFTLAGVACVIAIVVGGIKYVTSNGDSGDITSAKKTILYALVGLVVVIGAFTIVQLVVRVGQGA